MSAPNLEPLRDLWREGWDSGYEQGRADALAEIEARGQTVLAAVARPWRSVGPGDLIRAPGGTTWLVRAIVPRLDGRLDVVALAGGAPAGAPGGVDPDELAAVWVPMPEHVALSVLREAWPRMTCLGRVARWTSDVQP